jgi:predicted SAM-dependent methyltransferase
MANEMQKAVVRRLQDSRFLRQYFVGHGIDIGAGDDGFNKYSEMFPLVKSVRSWDVHDGDAQYLESVEDNKFDFVVSSHCLEHMYVPALALQNWIRVVKSGGHLIITVPDEDLYEQGLWPSRYNYDHKFSFTIQKNASWSPKSINVVDILSKFSNVIQIKKIELLDNFYLNTVGNIDQTRYYASECAIELVLLKK